MATKKKTQEITIRSSAAAQNKMHYSIHQHTAAELAQMKAETEFEKYRVVQDALYQSDFDRFVLPTLPFETDKQ